MWWCPASVDADADIMFDQLGIVTKFCRAPEPRQPVTREDQNVLGEIDDALDLLLDRPIGPEAQR